MIAVTTAALWAWTWNTRFNDYGLEAAHELHRAAARAHLGLPGRRALLRRLAAAAGALRAAGQPRGRQRPADLPSLGAALPACDRRAGRLARVGPAPRRRRSARRDRRRRALPSPTRSPTACCRSGIPRSCSARRSASRLCCSRSADTAELGRAGARPCDRQQGVGAARGRPRAARAAGRPLARTDRGRRRGRRAARPAVLLASASPGPGRRGRSSSRHRRRSSIPCRSSGSSARRGHWIPTMAPSTSSSGFRLPPRLAWRQRAPADRLAAACR